MGPSKKDTLATKQRAKAYRIRNLGNQLYGFSNRWWAILGEALVVVSLFGVNLFLLYPFFGRPDRVNVFSAPLVPLLASLTEKIVPFSYSLRIWLLVFMAFFPVSFYYFARDISGRRLVGALATLMAILPVGMFLPRRVSLGLLQQDGGHIASLTLSPLVCLLLMRFLRTGKFWTGLLSALAMAVVALTSPIGFLVLGTFMLVITFSEMLLGDGRLKALRFVVMVIMAAGFSAFWYSPKFIFIVFSSDQGQMIKQAFTNLIPPSFFLLPLLAIFGFLLFENRPQLQSVFIAFFLAVAFGLFSLGAGLGHASPSRFQAAFGLSVSFLFGVLVVGIFDFLRLSSWLKKFGRLGSYRRIVAYGVLIFLLIVLLIILFVFAGNLWDLESDRVLGLSSEKKVGLWEFKEQIGLIEGVLGYIITLMTGAGVLIIKTRLGM